MHDERTWTPSLSNNETFIYEHGHPPFRITKDFISITRLLTELEEIGNVRDFCILLFTYKDEVNKRNIAITNQNFYARKIPLIVFFG